MEQLRDLLATADQATLQPIQHLQPFLLTGIRFMLQSLLKFFAAFGDCERQWAGHIRFPPMHLFSE